MDINKYSDKVRAAAEKLYCGAMTVVEKKEEFDEDTKITDFAETVVLENEPCRVSYDSITVTGAQDGANIKAQEIRLFCSPDIDIKEGSKIIVTQHGVTEAYQKSGTPAVYKSHQEIKLRLFEDWA